MRQKMVKNIFFLHATLFVCLCFLVSMSDPAMALTCKATPGKIPVTIGYHGTKVKVEGEGLATQDVVVQISSKLGSAHLKYKGKAAGIFWMKLGNIVFEDVPKVYLIYSTNDVSKILSKEECKEFSIGYEALEKKAKIETNMKDFDRDKWMVEFFKFMEDENLYDEEIGQIKVDKKSHTYSVEIDWPFQAPPGEYNVEVFAVAGGKVVDQASAKIQVEQVGIVKKLSHMAFEKPALYGIIALVVAIVAGFGVGMIFKGGGAH